MRPRGAAWPTRSFKFKLLAYFALVALVPVGGAFYGFEALAKRYETQKIDNRLRIEMLRAKMPKVFKTPGSKLEINTGKEQNGFVCGPEEVEHLIALRQEALRRIAEKKGLPAPALTSDAENSTS